MLGDQGLSVIVNALGDQSTLNRLSIGGNFLTPNGLLHVTRLLLHLQRDSLTALNLGEHRGLFDSEGTTRDFASALSQCTKLENLCLTNSRLPSHAITAIFQAAANMTTLTTLAAYGSTQLQEQRLECLLDIIPRMDHLVHLAVNLDFTDALVLSCFQRNTSIRFLHGQSWVEITTGPVWIILERNRRLYQATKLLALEPQRTISLGVWALAVGWLARDSAGATATYKILREKLVHW
jgi:hypothetical protein